MQRGEGSGKEIGKERREILREERKKKIVQVQMPDKDKKDEKTEMREIEVEMRGFSRGEILKGRYPLVWWKVRCYECGGLGHRKRDHREMKRIDRKDETKKETKEDKKIEKETVREEKKTEDKEKDKGDKMETEKKDKKKDKKEKKMKKSDKKKIERREIGIETDREGIVEEKEKKDVEIATEKETETEEIEDKREREI